MLISIVSPELAGVPGIGRNWVSPELVSPELPGIPGLVSRDLRTNAAGKSSKQYPLLSFVCGQLNKELS